MAIVSFAFDFKCKPMIRKEGLKLEVWLLKDCWEPPWQPIKYGFLWRAWGKKPNLIIHRGGSEQQGNLFWIWHQTRIQFGICDVRRIRKEEDMVDVLDEEIPSDKLEVFLSSCNLRPLTWMQPGWNHISCVSEQTKLSSSNNLIGLYEFCDS